MKFKILFVLLVLFGLIQLVPYGKEHQPCSFK